MKEAEIRPKELFNRYLELSRQDLVRFFPSRSQFVYVSCPACDCALQLPGLEKLGFTYVLCAECDTLYLSPRPTADQLNTYYREAESVRFWSTHFYRATAEARREQIFHPRAQIVRALLTRHGLPEDTIFVDIGAGYGIFLEEVQRLGSFQTVMGIEPNPDLAEACRKRGFPIIEKSVETVLSSECQAGFASSFELLEHVFSPLEFLRSICGLLKPGGLLLFTTLTVSGFDIQVLWEHSKSVYPPHHINLLSVEGMEQLVKRAGLRLVELTTPGKLDVDIIVNMVRENPSLPLPRFVSYLLNERDESTKQAFQRFLSQNRLSSHIQIAAQA